MPTLLAPKIAQRNATTQVIAPHEVEEQYVPCKWLISTRDYFIMGDHGFFNDQKVELIAGEILVMPPMSEPHAQSLTDTSEKLFEPFIGRFKIRVQQPFDAGENSRPEPDIAVVRPESLSAISPPAQALLLVEISRSTLAYDRSTKASLYASVGVPDYWIVNLIENTVEVHRQPIERAAAEFGHDYASRVIYTRDQSIALLEVPEVSIVVGDMLP